MLKLNLACGSDTKENFINVDKWNRNEKINLICDLPKEFPFEQESIDYIYCSHFLEHLNWLEGRRFLRNCYNCLKHDSKLRLVLPDYKKIFRKYLENDNEFFKVFFEGLNNGDLQYYSEVYNNPEKIKEERKKNLPPDWHLSPRMEDRKRLQLLIRCYTHNIEIVDWFCHQYQEHKSLFDFESLNEILKNIGFSEAYETEIKEIDSHKLTRINSSLYIEAIK